MASIEKRARDGKVAWQARWRDPAGAQRKRSFARKVDAERFVTGVDHSQLIGNYVDPAAGRVVVAAWAATWLDAQSHLKPSTRARYEGIVSLHILPTWGRMRLVDVRHADVAAWVAGLSDAGLAPSTVRYVHRVFSLLLETRRP